MPEPTTDDLGVTTILLRRVHCGDPQALRDLLAQELDAIRSYVRQRLAGVVRERNDTGDIVHDVVVRILRHGPRFELRSRAQLRALLGRIVVNCLSSSAKQAGVLPAAVGDGDTVLDLDCGRARRHPSAPAAEAARHEEEDWLRIGFALLPGRDQDLLRWRQWDKIPFAVIGAQIGIAEDAARMRVNRAVQKLAQNVLRLKAGRLGDVLALDPGVGDDCKGAS